MDAALAETREYASFEREARAAAQLRSEHVVRIYDHGIARDGLPYLVMEFVEGETLTARLERQGPLSPTEVEALVSHIAKALGEAHGRGVVHRDVKPDNILLMEDPDREVGFSCKLIDFGLAKRTAQPAAESADPLRAGGGGAAAQESSLAGTPCYMSPEYFRGFTPADAALDRWALAVCAAEALTGRNPFDADTMPDVYRKVCLDPLPAPSSLRPDIPAAFDAWFARSCARDPSVRQASVADLAATLRAVLITR